MAGRTVLVDAQYGVTHILRPYANFEADYQGQSVTTNPIAFTEGGLALDALAGQPGYAPNLVRGLPVPMGAKIELWIPALVGGDPTGNNAGTCSYKYAVAWRLRSTFDYRQTRGPYHYPKQGQGVPDTTAPAGKQARVVKPAAWQPLQYIQAEPTPVLFGLQDDRSITDVHSLDIVARGGQLATPLVPGGLANSGEAQQGLLDPTTFSLAAKEPLYLGYEILALGDEMLLFGYRAAVDSKNAAKPTWSFAHVLGAMDELFSFFYGKGAAGGPFADIGVYVMIGSHT